jgi:hypothetical protein
MAALVAVASVGPTGCDLTTATPPPDVTVVPLQATPWPNGTLGRYGLRIDPQLLAGLPATVGGLPLVESAPLEIIALDEPDEATLFEAFAAAQAGSTTATDWMSVYVGQVREEDQNQAFYASWRDQFFEGACSQANGVGNVEPATINDWSVDLATCRGGTVAYTLWFESGALLSIQELGPRHLGRQLIEALD